MRNILLLSTTMGTPMIRNASLVALTAPLKLAMRKKEFPLFVMARSGKDATPPETATAVVPVRAVTAPSRFLSVSEILPVADVIGLPWPSTRLTEMGCKKREPANAAFG